MVWCWSDDLIVPRSNPLLVIKFLLLSLLTWKGGFEILPNNTWDLLQKAYGTSKKLRFQFRGQLNKPFSEPTYLYTNLRITVQRRLDPGMDTPVGFFKVGNQKEYQIIVIISFVHLERINTLCFTHKGVAGSIFAPCPCT